MDKLIVSVQFYSRDKTLRVKLPLTKKNRYLDKLDVEICKKKEAELDFCQHPVLIGYKTHIVVGCDGKHTLRFW